MAEETSITRLARCGACRGKIKVASDNGIVACPLCGLTLLNTVELAGLPPIVAPRADGEACWRAMVRERRLPEETGATELRASRLLLVPFWRLVDESKRSAARAGLVVSGADLSAVGLPCLSERRTRIRGLDVEPHTRVGDAMGRLDAAGGVDADVVDVTIGPPHQPPRKALDALAREAGEPGGPWWQLVYYPIWSFHYVVYNKEQFHVADATTAAAIGPARRMRWGAVALASIGPMFGVFLALAPFVGAAAALPAWLLGLAAMRLTLRSFRGG